MGTLVSLSGMRLFRGHPINDRRPGRMRHRVRRRGLHDVAGSTAVRSFIKFYSFAIWSGKGCVVSKFCLCVWSISYGFRREGERNRFPGNSSRRRSRSRTKSRRESGSGSGRTSRNGHGNRNRSLSGTGTGRGSGSSRSGSRSRSGSKEAEVHVEVDEEVDGDIISKVNV